jgi:hypothetical protein
MGCEDDKLTVVHGNNRWVLARTDRDAPTTDDVLETTAAFLSQTLGRASPAAQRSIFEVFSPNDDGKPQWAIGAARPATAEASQPESVDDALALSRPEGRLVGRHTDCPVLRTVGAERPWIVSVEFDWRGPTTVLPWPRRRIDPFGLSLDTPNNLDWLLLAASVTGPARHPDTSFTRELGKRGRKEVRRAKRALQNAATPLLVLAGVVGVGYVWSSLRKGKRQ